MAADRGILEWSDAAGGYLRNGVWVVPAASTGALEVALQNASNAALDLVTIAAPTVGATTPGSAQYHLVTDIAQLILATVPGTTIQLPIPGPMAAVFGPSSNVVNPANALVAAIIAAAIGVLADPSGNPVTAYVQGSKTSRRTEQN